VRIESRHQVAERRIGIDQRAPHLVVLRALAGKQEDQFRGIAGVGVGPHGIIQKKITAG
jgi:hypothetical protein